MQKVHLKRSDGHTVDIEVANAQQAEHLRQFHAASIGAGVTATLRSSDGSYRTIRLATQADADALMRYVRAETALAAQAGAANAMQQHPCTLVSGKFEALIHVASKDEVASLLAFAASAEPQTLAISSMPARVTETAIEYNKDGTIKKSTQTERDAVEG